METTKFMDTVPAISERAFVTALLEVIHGRLDEEARDFLAHPKPGHTLINFVILAGVAPRQICGGTKASD